MTKFELTSVYKRLVGEGGGRGECFNVRLEVGFFCYFSLPLTSPLCLTTSSLKTRCRAPHAPVPSPPSLLREPSPNSHSLSRSPLFALSREAEVRPRDEPALFHSPSLCHRRRRPKQNHNAPARAPLQAPLLRHPAALAGHRGEILCVLLMMMTTDSVSSRVVWREKNQEKGRIASAPDGRRRRHHPRFR